MERTLDEINAKINNGTAVIMTAQEFIDAFASGSELTFDDVDVVTTATKGLMSGIFGVFSFRIAPPKEHREFVGLTINGIPGFPGPCPNEFLGIVDVLLYGTAYAQDNPSYSGGVLFRDLVEGKPVHVVATSDLGAVVELDLTLDDMQFARLMGTRQGFKNYNAMVNPTSEPVDTIFSVLPFKGDCVEATFSGCGALNMFANDPTFETLGVGSPMLVNGGVGYLIGPGTRNNVAKPNMMTIADFKGMKPEYMGGFKTSFGTEPICSMAAAIPVLNETVFANLLHSDRDTSMPVMNVIGREKICEVTYYDVWDGNFVVKFDPRKCLACDNCPVEDVCPTGAFKKETGKGIDRTRCFNCGTCTLVCDEKAFSADLKSIEVDGKIVPIVLRQSDRAAAIKLAAELKAKILRGEFKLVSPVAKLDFATDVK
jgi:putative methanogenesis marker 16 metalloprotein